MWTITISQLLLCLLCSTSVIETSVLVNEDIEKNITEVISKYFAKRYKGFIDGNIVWTFADLYNIIEVNEKAETITTKLWLYLAYTYDLPEEVWTEYLPYIYEFYPGSNTIWKPDILILNSVQTVEKFATDPVVRKSCEDGVVYPCEIDSTLVVFPLSFTVITSCSFDVTDFPFDTQKCEITIGPWFTDTTVFPRTVWGTGPFMIFPVEEYDSMSLQSYQENSQWLLRSANLELKTRTAIHDVEKQFDTIVYTLVLERKPEFFVYTLVIPCSILSILTVLSIYLPVESGEKMGLGITMMLAQVVNLLILSGLTPSSSQYFPNLGYYFIATIVIIGVSLVYNTIIMMIFFYDYQELLPRLPCRGPKVSDNSLDPELNENNSDNGRIGGTIQSAFQTKINTESSPKKEKSNKSAPEGENSMERAIRELTATMNTPDTDADSAEVRRRKCFMYDHIFGTFILVIVIIIHIVFFVRYI